MKTQKANDLTNLLNEYGAGNLAKKILTRQLGINSRLNVSFVKQKRFNQLNTSLNKSLIGKKLHDSIKEKISFIKNNKTYKGLRHKASLPVRGQRTHTNAKTCKKKFR